MSQNPRADFWFSIVLTVLGAALAFESWRMPRLQDLGIDPVSAPGFTPGLLGLILAALGLLLFARSVRTPLTDAPSEGWGRFAITLFLCLAYAVGLVGRVPFWAATALFVAAFAGVFAARREPPLRALVIAVILAAVVSAAVTLVFTRVFLVRLP
ncbi:MAG: tripartite tricarboxylate transporter TctB family protein [Pseudomonadota bacterium]